MSNNMKNIFTILFFLSMVAGFCQNNDVPKEDANLIKDKYTDANLDTDYDKIYTSVQVQANPPGGINAFRKYIGSSFKLPEVKEKTTGVVIIKFVVWDDGTIRDCQIIKETPSNLGLGKEAVRVITNSEKWTPGQYNNKNVKQYYTLPLSIQIEELKVKK